jgi:hypothetical protein
MAWTLKREHTLSAYFQGGNMRTPKPGSVGHYSFKKDQNKEKISKGI